MAKSPFRIWEPWSLSFAFNVSIVLEKDLSSTAGFSIPFAIFSFSAGRYCTWSMWRVLIGNWFFSRKRSRPLTLPTIHLFPALVPTILLPSSPIPLEEHGPRTMKDIFSEGGGTSVHRLLERLSFMFTSNCTTWPTFSFTLHYFYAEISRFTQFLTTRIVLSSFICLFLFWEILNVNLTFAVYVKVFSPSYPSEKDFRDGLEEIYPWNKILTKHWEQGARRWTITRSPCHSSKRDF